MIEASIYSSIMTCLIMNSVEVVVVRRQSGCTQCVSDMFKEEGMALFTKGITAKMLNAVIGGTIFYLTMNKVDKLFGVNLID